MIDLLQKIGIKTEKLDASSKVKKDECDSNAFVNILDSAKNCFDKTKQQETRLSNHEQKSNTKKNCSKTTKVTQEKPKTENKNIKEHADFEKENDLTLENLKEATPLASNVQNNEQPVQNTAETNITQENIDFNIQNSELFLNEKITENNPFVFEQEIKKYEEGMDKNMSNPQKINTSVQEKLSLKSINQDIKEYIKFNQDTAKKINAGNEAKSTDTAKFDISKIFHLNSKQPIQTELPNQTDNAVKFDFSDSKQILEPENLKQTDNAVKFDFSDNKQILQPENLKQTDNTIKFDFSDNKQIIQPEILKQQDTTVKFDFSDNKQIIQPENLKQTDNAVKFDFSDSKQIIEPKNLKIADNSIKFDFSDNKQIIQPENLKVADNSIKFDFSDNKQIIEPENLKVADNSIKFDFSDNKQIIQPENLKIADNSIKFDFSDNKQIIQPENLKIADNSIKFDFSENNKNIQTDILKQTDVENIKVEFKPEVKENIQLETVKNDNFLPKENLQPKNPEQIIKDIPFENAIKENVAKDNIIKDTELSTEAQTFALTKKLNATENNLKNIKNIKPQNFDNEKSEIEFAKVDTQTIDKPLKETKNIETPSRENELPEIDNFIEQPKVQNISFADSLKQEKAEAKDFQEDNFVITESKISAKENEFNFNNMSNNNFSFSSSLNDLPSQLTKLSLNKVVDFGSVMKEQTSQINEQNFIEHVRNEAITKLSKGVTQISMILRPESLGRLHINIASTGEGITAQLTASNQQAADLLNKNISSLKQSLQEQGINVSEVSIKVADAQNSEMNFDTKGQNNDRMNDFLDGRSHENSSSKFAQEKLAKSLKNNNFFEDTKTKEDETEVKTHLIHNGLVDYKI